MKSKYQTSVTVQIKKAKTEATLEIFLENLGQNLKCHIKNKNKQTKNHKPHLLILLNLLVRKPVC